LAFLLTLLLNILIILSYYDGDPNDSEEKRKNDRINKPRLLRDMSVEDTERIFRICGIIMIICSSFVVVFFFCKKGPLYVRQAW
jgi:inositol 1,4,5-triphosphate receptor type 1/inositol 1,4,5-triphosphate receptor type 3